MFKVFRCEIFLCLHFEISSVWYYPGAYYMSTWVKSGLRLNGRMSWNWLVKDMDLSLTFKFKRLSHGSCLMLDSIVVIHSIFTHGYYYLCTLWKVKNESENDLTAINNFMFIWAEVEKKKKPSARKRPRFVSKFREMQWDIYDIYEGVISFGNNMIYKFQFYSSEISGK